MVLSLSLTVYKIILPVCTIIDFMAMMAGSLESPDIFYNLDAPNMIEAKICFIRLSNKQGKDFGKLMDDGHNVIVIAYSEHKWNIEN